MDCPNCGYKFHKVMDSKKVMKKAKATIQKAKPKVKSYAEKMGDWGKNINDNMADMGMGI